jgi:ribosomal protein S27E
MNGFWDNTPDLDLPATTEKPKVKKEELSIPETVYYKKVRCPKCGSDDCPVYSSEPPIRYHKCKICGYNFKSIEQK